MLRLVCNKGCKREFTLAKPGVATVRDDILKTYFKCPHCGQEYTAFYTNSGIRELQKMLGRLQNGPQRNKYKTKRRIKDLQDRITVGMERLKKDLEGQLT